MFNYRENIESTQYFAFQYVEEKLSSSIRSFPWIVVSSYLTKYFASRWSKRQSQEILLYGKPICNLEQNNNYFCCFVYREVKITGNKIKTTSGPYHFSRLRLVVQRVLYFDTKISASVYKLYNLMSWYFYVFTFWSYLLAKGRVFIF